MRQVVLDTETTGIEPKQGHRIIEIGCVELLNRRLTGNNYHQYIKPEREIDEGAIEVHGITNEFLADKPIFSDIMSSFINYIQGAELIIHNAPFDVGFLNHEFKLNRASVKNIDSICKVTDTLQMARKMHPGQRNSLDALTKRYHIEHFNRDLHGALLDSEILAQVYLAMTGGQESLFASSQESVATTSTESIKHAQRTVGPLRIIQASDEESKAHEAYLASIASD